MGSCELVPPITMGASASLKAALVVCLALICAVTASDDRYRKGECM